MDLAHGGHLTHGLAGQLLRPLLQRRALRRAPRHRDDRLRRGPRARRCEHRPKLIVCGASAYPRIIDFAAFRAIADEVGALLLADIAHIAGLWPPGVHPDPVPYCDVVTTTTHKTLRGPRGGLILCREEYAKAIDKAVFPGIQGGPLMHVIAAKAVCLQERPERSSSVQAQVLANCGRSAERSPTAACASSRAAPTTT